MAHCPWRPSSGRSQPVARAAVVAIDARQLGIAVVELGGGRTEPASRVDHAVGLTDVIGIG